MLKCASMYWCLMQIESVLGPLIHSICTYYEVFKPVYKARYDYAACSSAGSAIKHRQRTVSPWRLPRHGVDLINCVQLTQCPIKYDTLLYNNRGTVVGYRY